MSGDSGSLPAGYIPVSGLARLAQRLLPASRRAAGWAAPASPVQRPAAAAPSAPAFTPLFVGGCWRSGTTVLHALVCTSPRTNDYIGECSYFSALVNALSVGLEAFSIHTRYYFTSPEALITRHRPILGEELDRTWRRLGQPEILALKDPVLTDRFHLLARMFPTAKFLVAFREPLDTLASRIEVSRRENSGAEPTGEQIRTLCLQYVATYRAILHHRAEFGDRLRVIEYCSFVQGDHAVLHEFGLHDIDPRLLWQSATTDIAEHAGNPWLTPLYGGALSAASLGRHRGRLCEQTEAVIMALCGNVAREMRALVGRPAVAQMVLV